MTNSLAVALPTTLSRILLSALFILSGFSKLTNPGGTIAYITAAGLPLPTIGYAVALVVELVGGILLLIGYQTKIVSLIVALFTLAAAFGFHSNFADQNQMIHFLKNLAIAGGLLHVTAFGAGPFSLDGRKAS